MKSAKPIAPTSAQLVSQWEASLQETCAEIAQLTGPNRAAFLREIRVSVSDAPAYLATMQAQEKRLRKDIGRAKVNSAL